MNKIFAVLGVIILLLLVIIFIPHNTVSNTAINTYLITLKNVPSGKGMYQQLININLSYTYGINSNGSNILFKDGSNNTFLYAWIQSINATNLQVWIKNYNNSILIEMMILPSFENLFSANGYLGHAPVFKQPRIDDNGYLVFSGNPNVYYNNFHNYSGFSWFAGRRYLVDNGITEYGYNSTAAQGHSGIQLNVSLNETAFTAYANTEWNTFNGTTIVFEETALAIGLVNSGSGYASRWYPYANGNTITTNNSLYTQFQTEWFNFSYSSGTGHVKAGIMGYPTSYYNATESFTWHQTSVYLRDNYYINYIFLTPKMTMPTFTIAPIGTAPNPLYLSNSFTISNILLMDGKVKL